MIVATGVAVAGAALVRGGPRWWAAGTALALVAAVAIAIPAQLDLWRVEHSWDAWRRAASAKSLGILRDALDQAVASSRRAASDALEAGSDRAAAFDALAKLPDRHVEQAVVLYRGPQAFAWAGTTRI